MVRPIGRYGARDIKLQELLDFVYDKLYMDAYDGEEDAVHISGYRPYVIEVKRRIETKAKEGWKLKSLEIPREIDQLFMRARILGFEDELDL